MEKKRKRGGKKAQPPPPSSDDTKLVCFNVYNLKDESKLFTFRPSYVGDSKQKKRKMKMNIHHCRRHPEGKFEKLNLSPFAGLKKHGHSTKFVTLGSYIYCIGGIIIFLDNWVVNPRPFLKRVLRFDINRPQDGWKTCPPMIRPRGYPSLAVIDGKIYVFNGWFSNADAPHPWAEVFDPTLMKWEALPDLPPLPAPLNEGNLHLNGVVKILVAPVAEKKKILVGLKNFPLNKSFCTFAYNLLTNSWDDGPYDDNNWMDYAATHDRDPLVVDSTLYWYECDSIKAYDLDKKMWFCGTVDGVKGGEVLLFDEESTYDYRSPCLLHLNGEHFSLVSYDIESHHVSGSEFSCIRCGKLRLSKRLKANGKGYLKISLEFVQSYFVDGRVRNFEACMMDGMLGGDREYSSEEGSKSGQTVGDIVWGELSDCRCLDVY